MRKKRILFIVNIDWFFVSHRLPIAEAATRHGYNVHVVCADSGKHELIASRLVTPHNVHINRKGTGIWGELRYLVFLFQKVKKINPDIIHNSTLKPVIYGNFVASMLGIPAVSAVSGLGYNLSESNSGLSKNVMLLLMKLAFWGKQKHAIFQNRADLTFLKNAGVINPRIPYSTIKGVGVDLSFFQYASPQKKDKLKVLLSARMLRDKGVLEFVEAARRLKPLYQGLVEFVLIGREDLDNPAGLSETELENMVEEGYIFWKGHQEEVKRFLEEADIVVLPSYREGMPKSLIEACAIGRPIVTTDAIGCRECVDEGVNGFKVPIKDSVALSEAMEKLLLDESLRIRMGKNSRLKAEQEFDVSGVIEKHLEIYEQLLN